MYRKCYDHKNCFRNIIMRTILFKMVFGIVIIIFSCNYNTDSELIFQSNVFISQPLINKIIDNDYKHDENCIGFLSDQFNPEDPLLFNAKINLIQIDSLTGLKWKTLATPDSILDFLTVYSSDDDTNRVAYVFEIIESDNEVVKIFSIGSDDGIKIWLNGELILTDHRGRQVQAHSNLVSVKFKKGYNFILYKVDQGDGQWALYRKIIGISERNRILANNVTEHYGGLPMSSIVTDSTTRIELDIKYNSTLDSLHQIRFRWLDILSKEPLSSDINYLACNLPSYISISHSVKNWAILQIDVMNNKSSSPVFREEIPIAYKSFTDSLAIALTSNEYSANNQTNFEIRKDAVIQLFNLYEAGNEWEYSTRMQLHALLDLFLSINVSQEKDLTYAGPRNFGYISEIDNSIQPYRLIMPSGLSNKDKSFNLVYCPRWHIRKDIGFWEVYQARSHSVNIRRVNLSTISRSILIVPYSRIVIENKGSIIQELDQITNQVKSMFNINTDNISMFMYSSSGGEVLPQLLTEPIPLANMGLMNCILPEDKNVIVKIFNQLNATYPDINWLIWHGVQDEEAPVEMTRFLVKHLSTLTNKITYREEYYSTHRQYFGDPEKEFLLKISNKM